VTLAAVTEVAGLHPSTVRRYFANKEELLLELAERGWDAWRDALVDHRADARDLSPEAIAEAISATITSLPLFCDLLTLGKAGPPRMKRDPRTPPESRQRSLRCSPRR
jgi:AcrR family transcriptional regulator